MEIDKREKISKWKREREMEAELYKKSTQQTAASNHHIYPHNRLTGLSRRRPDCLRRVAQWLVQRLHKTHCSGRTNVFYGVEYLRSPFLEMFYIVALFALLLLLVLLIFAKPGHTAAFHVSCDIRRRSYSLLSIWSGCSSSSKSALKHLMF